MDVLILTVFVSVVLVIGELLFFAWNVHHDNHDHIDRLALLPLEAEAPITHEQTQARESS